MSEEEYWGLTQPELCALRDRFMEQEERLDRRAALVACVTANCHRDPRKAALKIEDFMPQTDKPKEEKKQMSEEEMLLMIKVWNEALEGTVE